MEFIRPETFHDQVILLLLTLFFLQILKSILLSLGFLQLRPHAERVERGQGGRIRPEDGSQADLLTPLLLVSVLQYMSEDDQAEMIPMVPDHPRQ